MPKAKTSARSSTRETKPPKCGNCGGPPHWAFAVTESGRFWLAWRWPFYPTGRAIAILCEACLVDLTNRQMGKRTYMRALKRRKGNENG